MGRLIIDGNSVFEIDEECLKKRKLKEECGINKYFENEPKNKIEEKKEKR